MRPILQVDKSGRVKFVSVLGSLCQIADGSKCLYSIHRLEWSKTVTVRIGGGGGGGPRALVFVVVVVDLVFHSADSGFDNLKIGRTRWQPWRFGEAARACWLLLLMWLCRYTTTTTSVRRQQQARRDGVRPRFPESRDQQITLGGHLVHHDHG